MRLIDADELLRKHKFDVKNWNRPYAVLNENIAKATTIDAVEVVRCVDCKYRDSTPGQPNILCYQMHDDDFCSYGERKEST